MARAPERVCSITLYEPIQDLDTLPGQTHSAQELLTDFKALSGRIRKAEPDDAMAAFVRFWSGPQSWDALPEPAKVRLSAYAPVVLRDFDDLFGGALRAEPGAFGGGVCLMSGTTSPKLVTPMTDRAALWFADPHRVVLNGLGHLAPVTDPGRVNAAIIEFINAQERGLIAA